MSDDKLEALARSVEEHREETRLHLDALASGQEEIRRALMGDMLPDGNEGIVAKVRRSDGIARGARKVGWAALVAGAGGWAKDLFTRT